MGRRAIALTVAGLAAAGAVAGIRHASRQTEVVGPDRREIEEFGEGLGRLGEGLGRLGKGVHGMGKGLSRAGQGLHESLRETARDRRD